MAHLPTDPDTMARLLAGLVHPDDAPPGYQVIARRTDAARRASQAASTAREQNGVTAMAVAFAAPPGAHQAAQPKRGVATAAAVATVVTIAVIASAPAGALTVVRRAFHALPGIQRSAAPEPPAVRQPARSLVGHANGDPNASETPLGVSLRRNRALPAEDREQVAGADARVVDAPNAKPATSGSTNGPSANANPNATKKPNPNKPAAAPGDASNSAKPGPSPNANATKAAPNNGPPAAHEPGLPTDNAERGQGHANGEPRHSTPNPKP